jgi:hypothetical protein
MNRFGSHPNHENHRLQEGPPPQGIFRGTADRKFFWHFSHRSAAGAPCFGAAAYIVTNGQSDTSRSDHYEYVSYAARENEDYFIKHKLSYEIRIQGIMGSGFTYLKYLHCRP